jgi:hypothetical protein
MFWFIFDFVARNQGIFDHNIVAGLANKMIHTVLTRIQVTRDTNLGFSHSANTFQQDYSNICG